MKLTGRIVGANIDFRTNKPCLTLEVNERNDFEALVDEMRDKDKLSIEVKQFRQHRSLNANAYAWLLIGKIADILRAGKDEIYLKLLKRYGQSELISVLSHVPIGNYPMISKEVSKCVSSAKRLDSKYGQVCRDRLEGTHKQKSGEISLFNCAKYKPLLDVDFDISHRCCDVMKKAPSHDYAKRTGRKPITAMMADESRLREQQWIKFGCNGFNMSSPVSNPMSFWTEQDVLQYIKKHEIPIASVYGEVEYSDHPEQIRIEDFGLECEGCEELHLTDCQRTGCIFCGFGCHREDSPSRFERLKITHPRQYEYCIGGGEYNEDGVWQPNKEGLGMGHVFEVLNKIYGEGFIKY